VRRRLKPVSLLLAAVLTAAFLIPGPPASASVRGDWWRARAITALSRFIASDTGAESAFGYGMAAGASGSLYGWTDPRTTLLLTRLLAGRNPDGGYGLGRTYDAFQDGTVNPATTTYTVTLASHAGPTLLAAYKGGATVVVRQDVQDVIDLLVNGCGRLALPGCVPPRVATPRGDCVAYSLDPNDATGCVHNVNAAVGAFLSSANGKGFGATGMQKLITNITIAELVAYREDDFWWPYLDDDPDLTGQDPDHNSGSAEAMYGLAYWVGREVAYRQMVYPPPVPGNAQDPIVHTRLTGLPGGPGSWSGTSTTVTLWCVLGDTWLAEQDTYLATITGDRAAQFAYYAARDARACAA
jgi:hypothetical protein